MKKIAILFIAVLSLFMTFGCGSNTSDLSHTVRYALEAEPASIDPAMSTNVPSSNVELQLFDGLTRLDEKGQPQPADAEKWTVSPDGKVYTFTLRDGLTWSNGEKLTAHDYEYAWKRVLNPKTGSPNAFMMYVLNNGEDYFNGKVSADEVGVKALDDRTLQVTLHNPTAYFLGLTAFHAYYPVPEKVVEQNPKTWASEASTFVGNGPFVLKEWKHKNEMIFAKNDKYWDKGAVKLNEMIWPIAESQATRVTLIENGEADMMVEPPVVNQEKLEKEGLFHVSPFLGLYYYEFNTAAEPVNDPRVRKALSMVIDRDLLVKSVIHGGKKPAYAFVPYGIIDAATKQDFRVEGGKLVDKNIDKAKELLKEAGYGPDKPVPTIQILYNTNELHKAIAEAVQAIWLKELGVKSELVNQETKVYYSSRHSGNFMVARASWTADYADPQTFLDVFYDPENNAQWHNPEYNAWMDVVHTTQNPAVRMEAMHKAEKILMDQAVVMPIYFTTQPYVINNRIAGFTMSNLGTIDFKKAYVVDGAQN